jgi:hypothetical protein
MSHPSIEVAEELEDITSNAFDIKDEMLKQTSNPSTEWKAAFSSKAKEPALAFQQTDSKLYPQPTESIEKNDTKFFTTYSREKAATFEVTFDNYDSAIQKIDQAQRILSKKGYLAEIKLSRSAASLSLEKLLENFEGSLDIELNVGYDSIVRDKGYEITLEYENGCFIGQKPERGLAAEAAETKEDIEKTLEEQGLLN